MLLIICLGLMATLALVSGQCDVGTGEVDNFDWNKFSADLIWYWREHAESPVENNLDCVTSIYGIPDGNTSFITVEAYDKSTKSHVTTYGNATNLSDKGFWEERYPPAVIPSGYVYVPAVDYNSYVILVYCPFESNQTLVYVAYRSSHPDEETKKKVEEQLQNSNLDVTSLVDWSADHCPQLESSTAGESSTETPV